MKSVGCRSDWVERMIWCPGEGGTSAPTKVKLRQRVALMRRRDGAQRRGMSMALGDGLKQPRSASHYGEDAEMLLDPEVLLVLLKMLHLTQFFL